MLTPIKAIRAKCLDCSGGQYSEVKFCPIEKCALYPYRMGKRPPREVNSPEGSDKDKTPEKAI